MTFPRDAEKLGAVSYPILIIEDDPELREALLVTLEDRGYHPVGAASGPQALELASRVEFLIAVADVRIQEGDGIETLRALKAEHPGLLCVVMTGYADQSAPLRALEVQVEDYLYKPFGGHDLLKVIERLERRGEEGASYADMFGRVLAGLAPVADGARPRPRPTRDDACLEEARHSAFRTYYVGVRSGQLDAPSALLIWDMLESGETLRQELAWSDNPPLDGYPRLQEGYRSLREIISTVKQTPLNQRPRGKGQTPAVQFDRFYHQLRAGNLSLELVKAAPRLRLADPVALCTDPELRALRERVWPT